ncbi:response regulator [Coleofasciculus sp. H7-2]|uniref:response regulator n=1 Tax=Coleofasciculus sp. H7-2 TaxID=3351545 RepID=UPI00366F6C43
MNILLVEDDEHLAQALTKTLSDRNYIIDRAADGQAGWQFARTGTYDLILLDVMLPTLDGISLCQRLRSLGRLMPILLYAAHEIDGDKVIALDAGADDYVVKPFDLEELAARVRTLLCHCCLLKPPILKNGSLGLDPPTLEGRYEGQNLHLTPKQYALLELFVRCPDQVFSRSELLEHLWSFEQPPAEETVRSHIKGLRQKLRAAGAPTDLIETVYGVGYRLKPAQSHPPIRGISSALHQPPTLAQTQAAVAKVWERLQGEIIARIDVVEEATTALLRDELGLEERHRAVWAAHKLAGSLGMFGFPWGSQLARQIEHSFQPETPLDREKAQHLCELVADLRRELRQPPAIGRKIRACSVDVEMQDRVSQIKSG